ncbi:protein Shroom2 isoform X2 [Clarias gariepinus]|uniref:protein Shroom2 isoform X2 n=1 Tax=Clarias gariepinus TaxID=13013 RepID=UPI00234C91F0|nr:protein Shroom2 isoform X2 [Clarias gariepinus]
MDAVDPPLGLESDFSVRDHRLLSDSDRTSAQNGRSEDAWRSVCVSLYGGAPWGFTLRGGREHREPLIITKVEEGSKAAAVRLQVGDELVNINDFPLSGYRQEAICLVKGSHKTLTLVVKRKNEPISRPHSWHSTKFNENQSDTAKTQSTPSPVWQTRYDASSFSSDLTTGWDQPNLRRVSDQFSSLGSMDSLEHGSYPYPPGRLSPSKSNGNSVEHLVGGKRDSAYSSFSTSSGTPDYTLSRSNAASTENMLYKVNQWDTGSRPSNGRHSQSQSEAVRQDDRTSYLQPPSVSSGRESPRIEEQPGYRHSASGRSSIAPVWHVPDIKKTMAPSPPPPAPPTRSDSYAATKIHEKGLVSSYPENPGMHAPSKIQAKGLKMATEMSENNQRIYHATESLLETSQNYNPQLKSGTVNPYDSYSQQVPLPNPNKKCSPSSAEPSYIRVAYHQRQYSDGSPFYAPPKTPATGKSQSCYSSMQELSNNHAPSYIQNQNRRHVSSQSSTAIDQNPDSQSSNSYYCVTSRQTSQGAAQASLLRVDDRNANSLSEFAQSEGDRTSISSQGQLKDRFSTSQVLHNPKNKDSYYRQVDSQQRVFTPVKRSSFDEAITKPSEHEVRGQTTITNSDGHFIKHLEQGMVSDSYRLGESHKENLLSTNETTVSPQRTPMLHSLSHESSRLVELQSEMGSGEGQQEFVDSLNCKQARRSDRFATTLRNEIQMRRAQLQKSRSAAVLSGPADREEEPSVWKSADTSSPSSDGSFTSAYKDHLKEAQARVLKATSFRRRDLEPVLMEHPGAEVLSSFNKDTPSLPSVSELPSSKPASGTNHVSRICGRKRFPVEKKVRSFSEPEKINELGVAEEITPQDNDVSIVNRRKVFEAAGKPAYSKPMLKQNLHISEDSRLDKPGELSESGQSESAKNDGDSKTSDSGPNSSQRLGTFAEYEATWNTQRKVDPRTSGRYHSADNILDPGADERRKPSYFHERSRSSPSEDFYGQNIPVQGRKSAECCRPERNLSDHDNSTSRMDKVIDDSSTVKKVPIKIVHSESITEKENRQYLHPSPEAPHSSQPTVLSLACLGSVEESSSPFCTYTRQREQENEAMGPQKEQELCANVSGPQEPPKDPCVDQRTNGVSAGSHSASLHSEEDEKRKVLARDIMDKDKSLADILDPSKRRTTMDLMEGIFPEGEQLVEEAHQRRRAGPKLTSSRSSEERREEDSMAAAAAAAAALVTSSAYYSTSAPKAELLIKMKDMQEQSEEVESEDELEAENDTELANKKQELIESLSKKLQVLREARESLQEDIQDNNALGEEVETTVQAVCKPNELEKFRMFVGDLDKVVSLLLSLSGRLARVENALNSLEEDAPLEERRTLMDKRKLLIRQHEDAKELKDNLDRRERVVYDILASHLQEENLADYEHFVKMKSALIIEQRKLEDKIKLGEEQLKCLMDSLPLDQRSHY